MRPLLLASLLLLLGGCSSFKLGTVAYIPYGQVGTVSVAPPGSAASAAK